MHSRLVFSTKPSGTVAVRCPRCWTGQWLHPNLHVCIKHLPVAHPNKWFSPSPPWTFHSTSRLPFKGCGAFQLMCLLCDVWVFSLHTWMIREAAFSRFNRFHARSNVTAADISVGHLSSKTKGCNYKVDRGDTITLLACEINSFRQLGWSSGFLLTALLLKNNLAGWSWTLCATLWMCGRTQNMN